MTEFDEHVAGWSPSGPIQRDRIATRWGGPGGVDPDPAVRANLPAAGVPRPQGPDRDESENTWLGVSL